MRVRLLAILVLALILFLGFPGAPAAIQGRPSLALVECSPPAGLQLPVGQGLAVRCRPRGDAQVIHVEFAVNGESTHAADVQANEMVSWTWVPAHRGQYTLSLAASVEGRRAAMISWQIRVVPGDSPVRIP